MTATKSWKYSHDFAWLGHKEVYFHGCNEITEIFPRFCLVVWFCKHNATCGNIPMAAMKSWKYSHDSAWLVVCKQ